MRRSTFINRGNRWFAQNHLLRAQLLAPIGHVVLSWSCGRNLGAWLAARVRT